MRIHSLGSMLSTTLATALLVVSSLSAQEVCDLSFTTESCTELPCPAGEYSAPACPFEQSEVPVPGAPDTLCHPYPQPRPEASKQCTSFDNQTGYRTAINTGQGVLPPSNPFDQETFPGTNLLPNVYTNTFDGLGNEMPNTLPSTPYEPYNLHDGPPVVNEIDPRSPNDDLREILRSLTDRLIPEVIDLERVAEGSPEEWTEYDRGELTIRQRAIKEAIGSALDILEGEPVPYRAYSGLPLLHYDGAAKNKPVVPIYDYGIDPATGQTTRTLVGGNVDVHQIWYDQHIESDTAFIDPAPILQTDSNGQLIDVPWTVTYTVDVLTGGHDDFSPFVTYTDYIPDPSGGTPKRPPNIGMDQTFFNMEEGTRTVFKIKMTYPKYLNLIYTWGWRMHPPRIQVIENAGKKVHYGKPTDGICPTEYEGCTLPQLEQAVFCNPGDPNALLLQPGDTVAGSIKNTCSIPNLPNCSALRCASGQPRYDQSGNPTQCEKNKLYAIDQIGDASPAKRMWMTLLDAQRAASQGSFESVSEIVSKRTMPAYYAFLDRTNLPCFASDPDTGHCIDPCLSPQPDGTCGEGLEPDPNSDVTILYVNNTIYGQLTAGGWVRWPDWETRYAEWSTEHQAWQRELATWQRQYDRWSKREPKTTAAPQRPREPVGPPLLNVTAYNDDAFPHSYTVADFGGNRGWENQFKSSVKVAGSGCWFTFGRAYWWMAAGAPNGFLCVPPADARGVPGKHRFEIQFNFEPSRRLRFYQFDPFHHDVAIYSIH